MADPSGIRESVVEDPFGPITLLEDIPLPSDLDSVDIRLPYDSPELRAAVKDIYPEARAIARPWAASMRLEPRPLGPGMLMMGGQVFISDLLAGQLEGLKWAFPFLASEGPELSEWSEGVHEPYKKASYAIRFLALSTALEAKEHYLTGLLGIKEISAMAPGALEEWPLPGQGAVFKLLEGAAKFKGLAIEESFWLNPKVSSSGVYFESGTGFSNCRLCKEDDCPFRRFPRI
jgi:hypothetical protein